MRTRRIRPSAPEATHWVAASAWPVKDLREEQQATTQSPRRATILSTSAAEPAIGFSRSTCNPFSRACEESDQCTEDMEISVNIDFKTLSSGVKKDTIINNLTVIGKDTPYYNINLNSVMIRYSKINHCDEIERYNDFKI